MKRLSGRQRWKPGKRVYVPFLSTNKESSRWFRDDEGVIVKWRSHKKTLLVQFQFRQETPLHTSYMTLVGNYSQEQIDDLGIELLD